MITSRVAVLTCSLVANAGLIAPPAVWVETTARGVEISRTKTEVEGITSATGARAVRLEFAAELINGIPDLIDDVEVGWQPGGRPLPVRHRDDLRASGSGSRDPRDPGRRRGPDRHRE
jgi:hypothetical protein